MRKLLFVLSLIIILTTVLVACGGSKDGDGTNDKDTGDTKDMKPVTFLANSVWPEDNWISQGMIEFSEKVLEATDGNVIIDVQTGGALGLDGPEILKAVRDNVVPISDIVASEVAGEEPMFGISTMPFLILNEEEGQIFNEVSQSYFDDAAKEWNQILLFGAKWPFAGFWTQDEVHTLDDLKGLNMRTYDQNGATVVQDAGGTPHPLPFSEVYSGLSTGLIDSVLTSSPTAVDAKFWEVLDYFVPTNVTAATNIFTMNLDEFNKLPTEYQDAIIEAGKEMDEVMAEKGLNLDNEMREIVQENGITILEPSDELISNLTEIGQSITDEWLEGASPEAKELVDEFLEAVGR